ncbi:hypothetical protein C7Y66_21555 [Chroococcidiopsis sp. CCALA 051]|uniref:YsnF/AvaK domain-containing protein n=1 Tax=Chroococcidiopsis sp. CCALA 051 TaxID=869949 RepID=UPI000D0D9090|nr:DUF2382 domain-containing protein [Chroococcidiopsis sp. CCALA 051]PSM47104.1 hypothetical protein C7Y66_21555 [Chroococcidiopsis sp. CCALA 051]
MIENEDIVDEQKNNDAPTSEQIDTETIDKRVSNGFNKAALGGIIGAVLGTVAIALADKKTARSINQTVKAAGNAVKDAADGVPLKVRNAVEAVKDVASSNGVNQTTTANIQANTQAAAATPLAVDTGMDIPTPTTNSQPVSSDIQLPEQQTFQLYEERLVANKKQVKTGEVAIAKHVETHKVRVCVPLEKERLVIEQIDIDNDTPVAPGEADFEQRELVRLEVYEEMAEIQKQPFVREQINVRKTVEYHNLEVEDSIRSEELDLNLQDLQMEQTST